MDAALSTFATTAAPRLKGAILGNPEDAIRGPAETLIPALADALGIAAVTIVPETPDPALSVRPDMSVLRGGVLIGHVELKAPGKSANPNRFPKGHDRTQWGKLKSLPNLIYFDGQQLSLWQSGTRVGEVLEVADLDTGATSTPPGLETLLRAFFDWRPVAPKTVNQLAAQTARLCRLLRDDVDEHIGRGTKAVLAVRDDWKTALHPGASNSEFADGFAQAITFGLLMARARRIELDQGSTLRGQLQNVGHELRASNTLIGAAIEYLVSDPAPLKTSLETLVRSLNVVDWNKLSKGDPDAWLYFYEPFLQTYDPSLHKATGTYYTPPEVVAEMVRLADDALSDAALFGLRGGLANRAVTVADPATGTGAFMLAILRRIRETVARDQGEGAVAGELVAVAKRIVGFELQFGPFVVAQLRLLAELLDLTSDPDAQPRVYLTNTLGDPEESAVALPALFAPLGESHREANRIKAEQPITLVIGNPPYKEKADGRGGWIERGRFGTTKGAATRAPLADWQPDTADSAHAKHLKNLYVYFWRWATWKAWGEGAGAKVEDRRGIVSFITVAGFLNGPGFKKMRAELRREADAIWVIDCTPEGHQPPVPSRVFQGVQHPVCIVMVARKGAEPSDDPARVRFRRLAAGPRAAKFAELRSIGLADAGWQAADGANGAPFLPDAAGLWGAGAPLLGMFSATSPGVLAGRTWVIAPDKESLAKRWDALMAEKRPAPKEKLFHPTMRKGQLADRHVNKMVQDGLSGHEVRAFPVGKDTGKVVEPTRYAFRSFDRQWIIPDNRLLLSARRPLWGVHSEQQVYLTALDAHSPSSGPSISFSGNIPDQHHYKGSFGGRATSLWRDAAATEPNVRPAVLDRLHFDLGLRPSPEDHFAWIAAIAAHPAYTARFADDLVRPGLRIPIPKDADVWKRGVVIGRRVIWLHTYGERFADAADGRMPGPPRIAGGPSIPKGGAISGDPAQFPNELRYDATVQRLHVGIGHVDAVSPAVWAYEVSGKKVIPQWFSYRRANRSRPTIGDKRPPSPLEAIKPDGWPSDYTADLIDLLHVLTMLTELETKQAALLDAVLAGDLIDLADAVADASVPGSVDAGDERQSEMFD